MAVPAPHVLASAVDGLLLLVFAVAGFAVVAGVAAVVLALLQAVLPGADSGAEEVHRQELEREREGQPQPAGAAGEPAETTAEPAEAAPGQG
jgi:hypothetical protein